MSYSCNDNQNYFVEAGRTTSRVLRPPGGRSSICLGWDDGSDTKKTAEAAVKKVDAPPPAAAPFVEDGSAPDEDKEVGKGEDRAAGTARTEADLGGRAPHASSSSVGDLIDFGYAAAAAAAAAPASSNAFASASNMNSGNVITDRPTSRVLNPPGGKSSIMLG